MRTSTLQTKPSSTSDSAPEQVEKERNRMEEQLGGAEVRDAGQRYHWSTYLYHALDQGHGSGLAENNLSIKSDLYPPADAHSTIEGCTPQGQSTQRQSAPADCSLSESPKVILSLASLLPLTLIALVECCFSHRE